MGNFEEELFYRTPPGDCFWSLKFRSKNTHATLKCLKVFCKKMLQKQPPEMFCKKGVLKSFTSLTENTCVGVSFNKVTGFQVNYIKKRIQRRCFPVNNAKFLRTPILKKIYIKLLLVLVFCKNRNVRPKFSL